LTTGIHQSPIAQCQKIIFFFLYFVPFIFPPPVSDYLLHFMVMVLNANEVIPGLIPVSLFGTIISGAEQTVWDK